MLRESWHGYCRLRTSCTIHQQMSCISSLANMFKQSNFQVLLTDWSKMGPKGSQGSQPKWERRHLSERHPWLQGTAPRRGQDFQSRGHIGLEGRWTLPVQGAPRHKKTPSNRVVTCLYMVSIGVHMSSRNFLYVRHGKFTFPSMDTM